MSTEVKSLESDVKALKENYFKASCLGGGAVIVVMGWLATTNFYSIPKAIDEALKGRAIIQCEAAAQHSAAAALASEKAARESAAQIAKLQTEVGTLNFKVVQAGSQDVRTNGQKLAFTELFKSPNPNASQFVLASASVASNPEIHYSPFVEKSNGGFRVKLHDIDGHPHDVVVRVDYLIVEPTTQSSGMQPVASTK